MTTGHTPTPWKISGATHVFAPGETGGNVCSMSEPHATSLVQYTPAALGSEEAYANAAFIVKAVNAHDALVSALREVAELTARQQLPLTAQIHELVTAAISKAEQTP